MRVTPAAQVEMVEEMLNRVEFRAVCCRREADYDRMFGDHDLSRRSEEVREELLGLTRSAHVWRDDRRELGLGIRARDADDVDDRLELARMVHELARELGLLDGGMGGKQWTHAFEVSLPPQRLGEVALDERLVTT